MSPLPIGSGVTEAACKTVFTERLKRSGMIWSKPGVQMILDLRVILLSGVWGEVYTATLDPPLPPNPITPPPSALPAPRKPR